MKSSFLACVCGASLALAGAQPVLGQSQYGASPRPRLCRRRLGLLRRSAPRPAYGSPSLLPLPAVSMSRGAAGSYGVRPAAAYSATESLPNPSASGLAPLPEPIPATQSETAGSPSDMAPSYNQDPNAVSAPNYGAGPSLIPSGGLGGGAGVGAGGLGAGGLGVGRGYDTTGGACDQALFGGYCGGLWFASAGGLALTRNEPNRFWTTYESNNNPDQLMNTQFAKPGWGGGGEVTVGRWFGGGGAGALGGLGGGGLGGGGLGGGGLGGGAMGGIGAMGLGGAGGGAGSCGSGSCGGCGGCCCPIGLSATYWGVSPMTGSYTLTSPTSSLSTPINDGYVNINNGNPSSPNPASYFWDSSKQQSISRVDRINNVEVNLMALSLLGTGRTQAIWLAGVRYFRFDETLTYGGTAYGYNFNDANGSQALYLRDRSINNLVGPQIGVILNHYCTQRFSIFAAPKMAVMGNYTTCQNTLYTGDGYSQFDLQGSKTDVSLLGQLDLGVNYWIKPWCSIYAGYRVVGITSMALADNQFLPYLADTTGFQQPKTNGDLILTGGFAGMLFRF